MSTWVPILSSEYKIFSEYSLVLGGLPVFYYTAVCLLHRVQQFHHNGTGCNWIPLDIKWTCLFSFTLRWRMWLQKYSGRFPGNLSLISRKISHFLILSYLFLLYLPISRLFLNYFFFVSRILLTSRSFLAEFSAILRLLLVDSPISWMSFWVKWEFVIYSEWLYRVTGPVAYTSCSQW